MMVPLENKEKFKLINNTKEKLKSITTEYIDKNCVEFKKEEMKNAFEEKIADLAEKMSEGKIYDCEDDYFYNQLE